MKSLLRKSVAVFAAVSVLLSQPIGFCAEENNSVTISASAASGGAFIAYEEAMEVSSDSAEKYGFTDSVEDGISALDVLTALHETVYGGAFTAQTAGDYLKVSGGWISKAFGVSTSAAGFLTDRKYCSDTVDAARITNGGSFEFFIFQNAEFYSDYYTHIDDFTVKRGEEITLQSGGWEFMTGYSDNPVRRCGQGVRLAYVGEDGTLTPIEGTESGEDGSINAVFDTAGEYKISLTGAVECEAFNYTTYEYEKTAAPVIPSVTTVTVTDEDVSLEGSGTKENPYLIGSYDDLAYMRGELVNKGHTMSGRYFRLTDDITLPSDWEPIGCYIDESLKNSSGGTDARNGKNIYAFMGTLDGDNHTVTVAEGAKPLFFAVADARVENLNIYGKRIEDAGLVSGSFVNYGPDGDYSTGVPEMLELENVTLKSGSSTLKSGLVNGSGSGANAVRIRNCKIEDGVTVGYTGDQTGIGSFIGELNGSVTDCVSGAEVKGKDAVGGLVGRKGQAYGECVISGSAFTGRVSASGRGAGGIIGTGYESDSAPNTPVVSVRSCFAAAEVTGGDYVGGIIGSEAGVEEAWNDGEISNNFFYGTLGTLNRNAVKGGIAGYFRSLDGCQKTENNYYLSSAAQTGFGAIENLLVKSGDIDCGGGDREVIKNIIVSPYGKDFAFDAKEAASGAAAEQFAGGEILERLNSRAADGEKWVQADKYPVLSGAAVIDGITVSDGYKKTYYIGEELDLSGAQITAHKTDGTSAALSPDDVTVSGYDKNTRGKQSVTVSYGAHSTVVEVTVILKPSGGDKNTITVSFTLKGDKIHDSDADGKIHGNTMGGLEIWASNSKCVVDINATAADAARQVLDKEGIVWDNPTGNYVKSITRGGVTIGEFTNGKNSGWLYSINGKQPSNGMADQYLSSGDKIILYYTDDWSKETGAEKWTSTGGGGGSVKPAATPAPTKDPGNERAPGATAAPVPENEKKFKDVPETHWAYGFVKELTQKGYLSGRSETRFAPEDNITRAEFAAVLSRMSGDAAQDSETSFTDIPNGAWYAKSVAWAVRAGVTAGVGEARFAPEDFITRQDMAVMIKRYADYKSLNFKGENNGEAFTDEDDIASYAAEAVLAARGAGIISGTEDGSFAPARYATRAEAAKMLSSLIKLAENNGGKNEK